MRTLIVSAILAMTPILAQAECSWQHQQAAMTCADGLVYDQETKECVKIVG